MFLAWSISCMAFFGSLYASEVLRFVPSNLCWYQRICMYPLIIMFAVALWRGEIVSIIPYLLPQMILGMFFSLYQVAIQEILDFSPFNFLCAHGGHCSEKFPIGLGFISLPMLSFVAFSLILFLSIFAYSFKASASCRQR